MKQIVDRGSVGEKTRKYDFHKKHFSQYILTFQITYGNSI